MRDGTIDGKLGTHEEDTTELEDDREDNEDDNARAEDDEDDTARAEEDEEEDEVGDDEEGDDARGVPGVAGNPRNSLSTIASAGPRHSVFK